MIALCRAKCCIVHLKANRMDHANPMAQCGLKGNLIVYPQCPSKIAKKLPPSIEEITLPICVLFVGSSPPTDEWICEKAKPLAVQVNKVQQALCWLKCHNHLYKDIKIDEAVLRELDANPCLPFHIEHIVPSHVTESSTSGYDPSGSQILHDDINTGQCQPNANENNLSAPEIPFASVVILDIENVISSSQLAVAAIRHMRKKGGAYLQVPHEPQPANEFFNADLSYDVSHSFSVGSWQF